VRTDQRMRYTNTTLQPEIFRPSHCHDETARLSWLTVLSDEDEFCADVAWRFVCNVAFAAVQIVPVKLAVYAQTVGVDRIQGEEVTAEVISTGHRQRVMSVN